MAQLINPEKLKKQIVKEIFNIDSGVSQDCPDHSRIGPPEIHVHDNFVLYDLYCSGFRAPRQDGYRASIEICSRCTFQNRPEEIRTFIQRKNGSPLEKY